jgi:[ribosomal protein S18]-alanine N-acetyltransferase
MSAVPREQRWLQPMQTAGLDAVLAIESAAYEFPWSRGNFIDSLAAGYWAQWLIGASSQLLGYVVAMYGVHEMHLLNLTVAPAHQHAGHARFMLDALVGQAAQQRAEALWLEVRVSNLRGRALYRRYGFGEIGVRKGYYPAAQGRREDAVVMSLPIDGGRRALD